MGIGSRAVIVAALLVAACSGAQTDAGGEESTNSNCPPAGQTMAFSQLIAQTQQFVGCEVTTEVSFVATGVGLAVLPFNVEGQTVFQILPPGQAPAAGPLGGVMAYYAAVRNAGATALFTTQPGARLTLRGSIQYQASGNAFSGSTMDTGTTARLFRVRSISVGGAAPSSGGAAATSATPPTPPVETSPGCAEGHTITPATAGHCCWPEQTWSEPLGRCNGAPRCPPGFVGEGAGCMRAAAPPTPAQPSAASASVPVAAPAAMTTSAAASSTSNTTRSSMWSAERPRPRRTSGGGFPLAVAGGVTFGVGYVPSFVLGAIMFATPTPGVGGLLWVPVLGPFIATGFTGGQAGGIAILVVDGLVQVTGAALLIPGLVMLASGGGAARSRESAAVGAATPWALMPWSSANARGAQFAFRF